MNWGGGSTPPPTIPTLTKTVFVAYNTLFLEVHHHRLLLVWQAPLGMRSAKCRHQSSEWMILSHVSCFVQGEVIGFQVLLDSFE